MIDIPADTEDRHAYPMVQPNERWIFNKLLLAEKLGYRCAPCGTPVTNAGAYCVRPIMNCAGNGMGGVMKFISVAASPDNDETIRGGLSQPPYAAGYFWCEWFDGWHGWTDFTDDAPTDECGGIPGPQVFDYESHINGEPYILAALPAVLQSLSRNLLVEHIGGKIIEVSPRHMPWQHGRGNSYMQKYRPESPWLMGDEAGDPFYWRVLPRSV